jgi:hypothetical protein
MHWLTCTFQYNAADLRVKVRHSIRETSKTKTYATAPVDVLYKKRKESLRRCQAKNMKTKEKEEAIQHQG